MLWEGRFKPEEQGQTQHSRQPFSKAFQKETSFAAFDNSATLTPRSGNPKLAQKQANPSTSNQEARNLEEEANLQPSIATSTQTLHAATAVGRTSSSQALSSRTPCKGLKNRVRYFFVEDAVHHVDSTAKLLDPSFQGKLHVTMVCDASHSSSC